MWRTQTLKKLKGHIRKELTAIGLAQIMQLLILSRSFSRIKVWSDDSSSARRSHLQTLQDETPDTLPYLLEEEVADVIRSLTLALPDASFGEA